MKFVTKKVLIFIVFISYVVSSILSSVKYDVWDLAALSDVLKIQASMESYYEIHKEYPPIGNSCGDFFELKKYIGEDNTNFLSKVSSQRTFIEWLGKRPLYHIFASVGSDGQTYVISVGGVGRGGVIKGDILSCNCDSPNYCLGKI